jgi:NTP pyrophosphatase (non-canonical NTP hydrolase)
MNDIQILINELVKFRDTRHWEQFHNTKELVDRNKLKEELADIFAFSLLLAGKHGFDVKEIVLEKIRKNNEKYPVDKAKGTSKKYNEF